MAGFQLPALYPIADMETLARREMSVAAFAGQLVAAGAGVVQLRDKLGSPAEVLRHAAEVSAALAGSRCLPVMNDRADLAVLAGWQAVHVGHTDMPPEAVRLVFPAAVRGQVVVGVSTHDEAQVRAAEVGDADYLAVGPVFATGTKADAEAVVGLEGVRRARALTRKPLVAIGGITLENAVAVRRAGADSVAVIGGLFRPDASVQAVAAEFLHLLAD